VIDAVVFDLFETLVTERGPRWKPWSFEAESLGLDPEDFHREKRARYHKRCVGAYADYPSLLREIFRALEREPDEPRIADLAKERTQRMTHPFADVEPPIIEMLERLRAMGLRLAMLSNTTGDEVGSWGACALNGLFDTVVFSHEAGLAKPDPEIYLLACRRLGVEPARALFVGDGMSNELAGAAGVGMTPLCATWFIDRWPADARRTRRAEWTDGYPKLASPGDVVDAVGPPRRQGDERHGA